MILSPPVNERLALLLLDDTEEGTLGTKASHTDCHLCDDLVGLILDAAALLHGEVLELQHADCRLVADDNGALVRIGCREYMAVALKDVGVVITAAREMRALDDIKAGKADDVALDDGTACTVVAVEVLKRRSKGRVELRRKVGVALTRRDVVVRHLCLGLKEDVVDGVARVAIDARTTRNGTLDDAALPVACDVLLRVQCLLGALCKYGCIIAEGKSVAQLCRIRGTEVVVGNELVEVKDEGVCREKAIELDDTLGLLDVLLPLLMERSSVLPCVTEARWKAVRVSPAKTLRARASFFSSGVTTPLSAIGFAIVMFGMLVSPSF